VKREEEEIGREEKGKEKEKRGKGKKRKDKKRKGKEKRRRRKKNGNELSFFKKYDSHITLTILFWVIKIKCDSYVK
jgi:hypothetical protein